MDKNVKMKDIKELGEQLGELQRVCREKKIPVMIAFEGYGAAGKGLQIGNLIQALDPRGFKVYAVKNETEEEWMHPFMWRFWTKIPEKGRIAPFMRPVPEVSFSKENPLPLLSPVLGLGERRHSTDSIATLSQVKCRLFPAMITRYFKETA